MVNKKGSIIDLMTIAVIVTFLAILIIIVGKFVSDVNTQVQANTNLPNISKQISQDYASKQVALWDGLWLFIFIGLWISALILTTMDDVNPIFFVFGWLLLIVIVYAGMLMANVYDEVANSPGLASTSAQYVYIPYVFEHFAIFLTVIGMSLLFALYGRFKSAN